MLKWYHYIMLLFGGAFVANFVPHFVEGITGDMFPTPFADPPGQGMSSSTVNVLWALGNLVAGYFLLKGSRFAPHDLKTVGVAFIGFAAMAIQLSMVFAEAA